MQEDYIVEPYWDEVAKNIHQRKDIRIIAGEDDPFYRYKRNEFLKMFNQVDFKNKRVLEVGSGPGGNLAVVYEKGVAKLTGVDISATMVSLAKENLAGKNIDIIKINGKELPFEDHSYDLIYTSTVLQHNVDEQNLFKIIDEIARVSAKEVILFERIESRIKGNETTTGRPVSYYANLLKKHGYTLEEQEFLPIQVSYYVCGAIRKVFNSPRHKEGEPFTKFSLALQKIFLPVTKALDKIVPSKRDVAKLRFVKK